MYAMTPGARLYYERHNERRGPTVILVHGNGDNHRMWAMQVPALSAAFDTITLDVRGHGETETLDRDYSYEACADDIAALLDALGIPSAAVVGYSMGGAIASTFVLRHPQRAWALVLSNSGAQLTAPTAEQLATQAQRREELIAAIERQGMIALWDQYLPQIFTQEFRNRSPVALSAYRSAFLSNHPAEFLRRVRAAPRPMAPMPYEQITVPTLVIAGEQDGYGAPDAARQVAARIRGAQVVVFPYSHGVPIEAPQEFNRTLLGFLHAASARRRAVALPAG
jgi:pimeloyl-ACP methyl ester carboxylesterase